MTFARWNHLTVHFSECMPVVKRRVTVLTLPYATRVKDSKIVHFLSRSDPILKAFGYHHTKTTIMRWVWIPTLANLPVMTVLTLPYTTCVKDSKIVHFLSRSDPILETFSYHHTNTTIMRWVWIPTVANLPVTYIYEQELTRVLYF